MGSARMTSPPACRSARRTESAGGWSALGGGISGCGDMTVFDDGRGPALFVGGSAFDSADSFLSKWGCPFSSTMPRVRRR